MKALLLEGKGKVSEMKVGNIQKPHPAKGEILVKIKATALNPVDLIHLALSRKWEKKSQLSKSETALYIIAIYQKKAGLHNTE
jgi:NADPH:quinone reductase-like Zn-dependent oxidoreductase